MKRRSFFKSCGGAIAALMLPFGVKIEFNHPKALDYEEWVNTPIPNFRMEITRYSRHVNEAYLDYLKFVLNQPGTVWKSNIQEK